MTYITSLIQQGTVVSQMILSLIQLNDGRSLFVSINKLSISGTNNYFLKHISFLYVEKLTSMIYSVFSHVKILYINISYIPYSIVCGVIRFNSQNYLYKLFYLWTDFCTGWTFTHYTLSSRSLICKSYDLCYLTWCPCQTFELFYAWYSFYCWCQ